MKRTRTFKNVLVISGELFYKFDCEESHIWVNENLVEIQINN